MSAWLSALVWATLNPAALLATLLPRGLELRLGRWLGLLYLWLDPRRRRVGYDNIRRCLPELGERGWRRLLRRNYEHYGVLALELLHECSPVPGHYRRYATRIGNVEGLENWRKAAARGKGVIFASAHMGNWEIMAAGATLAGIPVVMVTRRLKPPWLLKKIETARLSTGLRAAYQPRTLPALMKALRKGEAVGFVIDQYAPPPMGVPVPFFGVQVDTLAAVGPLAKRTGAAVVPVSTYRDPEGVVHIVFEPELDLSRDLADPSRVTAILAAKVESWIRARPEQWLWVHRRFKHVEWPAEQD